MEYYWWFVFALVFFIMEIITPGFVLMWFGIGALISGVLDLLGVHDIILQVIVFVVTSIVLVSLSRTLFKNVFMRSSPGAGLKTNAEALIGKTGVVTEAIDNERSTGRILVDGQDWAARSENVEVIRPSERVRVTGFEGARLIVTRA
ncbi:MAG: NfeD family protein [Bacteroidota bacterium]|nr:NfeD family protein [Bacteroidota bacterium]